MLTTLFAALTVFSDIFAHRLHNVVSFFKIIFFYGKTVLPGQKPDLPIMHMVLYSALRRSERQPHGDWLPLPHYRLLSWSAAAPLLLRHHLLPHLCHCLGSTGSFRYCKIGIITFGTVQILCYRISNCGRNTCNLCSCIFM